MKKIVRTISTFQRGVQRFTYSLTRPFLPSYKVVFTMYQVVPGLPVGKDEKSFDFERGAEREAQAFYHKVLTTTDSHGVMPAALQLKRRKKVIAQKHFGPVSEIHALLAKR